MDKTNPILKFVLENDNDEEDIPNKEMELDVTADNEYDYWEANYKPITNPVVEDAPYNGCMFETFGEELHFVKTVDPKFVWTLVEGDSASLHISAGFHHVNRQGFFVTEVSWKTGTESFIADKGDPSTPEEWADELILNEMPRENWLEWWKRNSMSMKTKFVRGPVFSRTGAIPASLIKQIIAVIDRKMAEAEAANQ